MSNNAYRWFTGTYPFDEASCGCCLTQHGCLGPGWCDDPDHAALRREIADSEIVLHMNAAVRLDRKEGHPLTSDERSVLKLEHLDLCVSHHFAVLLALRKKYKHLWAENPVPDDLLLSLPQ